MEDVPLDDNPIFTEPAPEGWEESFSKPLGKRRFDAIVKRMQINTQKKCKLRDLAKVVIGACDVMRQDILEVLQGFRPPIFSDELMGEISKYKLPEKLPAPLFDKVYMALAKPYGDTIKFFSTDRLIEERLHHLVHYALSCIKYDPYWFSKKRSAVRSESHNLDQIMYYERLSGFYAACEDIEVGAYIPAPSDKEFNQYYRVTAQLITGRGQIGMILVSATDDVKLDTLRVTRGSPTPPGGLDFLSFAITDMEPDIGRIGYESGLPYQDAINRIVGKVDVEIGYSIGGTFAQWRAADNPLDLSSIWLYKSPGVPKEVWEKFNKGAVARNSPLDLFLFQARGDIVDFAGDMPLGYNAPENVRVALYELIVPNLNPHRYAFDIDKISIEEIESNLIDDYLSNKSKTFIETHRKRFGKAVAVPFLKLWQKLFSKRKRARIHEIRGLTVEVPTSDQNGLEVLTQKSKH